MYKTNVTYENFDGETVTKTLYFNLTEAEMTKIYLRYDGKFDQYVDSIVHPTDEDGNKVAPNPGKVISLFEMLALEAYGVRNEDNDFVKDEKKTKAFLSSEAYSKFFMNLLSDENAQQEFFIGIMPKEISAKVAEEFKENKEKTLQELKEVQGISISE